MTQDEIIGMVQEAFQLPNCEVYVDDLKRFAALVAAHEREALAESKPAPDGRIPKTVFTIEDIGKAAEMGRQAGMIDALAEPEYYDCGGTIGVVHKSQCSAAMKRNGKPCEAWSPDDMAYRPNGLSMDTQDNLKQRIQELEQQNAALKAVVDAWNNVEPVKQEPVAWMQDSIELYVKDRPDNWHTIPLYAAPVRTKDLTDDEIAKAIGLDDLDLVTIGELEDARAVIAADRELNK